MNSYSIRLAWAGAMIGVLALSATVFANARPPGEETAPEALLAAETAVQSTEPAPEAVAAMAQAETASAPAGPFLAALRLGEGVETRRVFLCDAWGNPLEELPPERQRELTLGPLEPGVYSLWRGGEKLGSFRLLENAALAEAEGQLWTDGELLHLERFVPGTALLTLRLTAPGYYSLGLRDQNGLGWTRDLYIAPEAPEEPEGGWLRVLAFPGLPAGRYTLVRRGEPLLQLTVPAGESAEAELEIEK